MTVLRVVLQARTTSTRLPAKALLPIAGMPSSILAAKRAARDGLDLVFATSTDPTDDLLAATATSAGLKVFRGSKDDVLGRYAAATADMGEGDVVIRITGDDPVPDAEFLRALVTSRAQRGVEMLFSMSPADGLPHGVAAQAFSAGALRRANREAKQDFEREHVGPWMVKHLTSAVFDDYAALDLGHLRCTLDTIDDYFVLQTLFAGIADPLGTSWRSLVNTLNASSPWRGLPFRYLRGQPGGDITVERLSALVPEVAGDVAPETIRQAIRCGATHFVATPGASARALGAGLAQGWSGRASVILRLAPPADLAKSRVADWVELSLLGACRDLGLARLHTVVLPSPAGARGAALIELCQDAKTRGLVRHIGIAVDTVAAARKWLKRSEITHVEIAQPTMARSVTDRADAMILARSPVELVTETLHLDWAQATVVPLAASTAWPGLVDAARTARPFKGSR